MALQNGVDGISSAEDIVKELALTRKAVESSNRKIATGDDGKTKGESLEDRLHTLARDGAALQWKQDVESYRKIENEDAEAKVACLAGILCEQEPTAVCYRQLYDREFLPLCDYAIHQGTESVRSELKEIKYPTECAGIVNDEEDEEEEGKNEAEANTILVHLASICDRIQRIQTLQSSTTHHMLHNSSGVPPPSRLLDPLLLEFCRPVAERVRFHFLETSMDRPTTTRIDRLPEWLSTYMKEHVFHRNGPFELVECAAPHLIPAFLNEMIRLLQWVMTSRDVFRHPHVLAKPRLLSTAVQHILQLDAYIQSLTTERLVSLADVCIAGDLELLEWWLTRERESMVHTFSSATTTENSMDVLAAVWASAHAKARLFQYSQPYHEQVLVPLATAAIDSLHHRAQAIRKQWTGRNVSPRQFVTFVQDYATVLEDVERTADIVNDHDETATEENRLVRSLHGLARAVVDDGVMDCVEVILVERAQLAKYMMQCSHVLSVEDDSMIEDVCQEISVDLMETQRVLYALLHYAPTALTNRVLTAVAEQLLDVVLDWSGMTPELQPPGTQLLVRDIRALFTMTAALPSRQAQRLLQVADILDRDDTTWDSWEETLRALLGQTDGSPLREESFGADHKLYEQAMSMLLAKGVGEALELSDVLSIMHRRRRRKEEGYSI